MYLKFCYDQIHVVDVNVEKMTMKTKYGFYEFSQFHELEFS